MRAVFTFLIISLLLLAHSANALSLIRDAETEQLLRDYATPIFEAANLDPSSIKIFIVNDPSINAFVAGGANLFIHTGLILASDDPNTLIGVIAHETGHIAGGHLARGTEELKDAQLSTVLAYVLGAAAGLAGGGDAAAGVLSAGQHLAQRNLLSFSRMNEQAADQAALTYLDKTNTSAAGMLNMMEKLRARETLYRGNVDPYSLTHPLSKERISHIRGHLLKQSKNITKTSAKLIERHARMLGKLKGFLNPPKITLANTGKKTTADRLARIIAQHRLSQTDKALQGIDALLREEPKNPYFIELKGQILSESGRHKQALKYSKLAAQMLPDSGLLRTDYARELLSQDNPNYAIASKELTKSSQQDKTNSLTWKLLGQAEAALKHNGKAALANAEAALLNSDAELARRYAKEALDKLPKGSPALLRAQDAREEAIRLQKEKKENPS